MGREAPRQMVSQDFRALSAARAVRARLLSERYPSAGEVLGFYAALATFQGRIFPEARDRAAVIAFHEELIELVVESGSDVLRVAAKELDEATCRQALADYWRQIDTSSPVSFFARVLLQPHAAHLPEIEPGARSAAIAENCCPRCGHRPQVALLRPLGEGRELSLLCSLCLGEWVFSRGLCPGCGEAAEENVANYSAEGYDHVQVQACEACKVYLHVVDLGKDPTAIPEVDELAVLPLDVWARERGYRKVQTNLVGI